MEREQTGALGLDARLLRHRARPDSEDAVQLAEDLVHANRVAEALEVTVEALRASPEDGRLLLVQARAWLQEGQLENAQASLIKAARVSPNSKECFRLLGEVLLKRGDPVRALRVIERARTLDPQDRAIQLLYERCARFARIAETAGAGDLIPASIVPPGGEPSKDERTVARAELSERLAKAAASEHVSLGFIDEGPRHDDKTSVLPTPEAPREAKREAAPLPPEPIHELKHRIATPVERARSSGLGETDDIPPDYVPVGALRSPAPPKDLIAAKEHKSDDREPDPFPERSEPVQSSIAPMSRGTDRPKRSDPAPAPSKGRWALMVVFLLILAAATYLGWMMWAREEALPPTSGLRALPSEPIELARAAESPSTPSEELPAPVVAPEERLADAQRALAEHAYGTALEALSATTPPAGLRTAWNLAEAQARIGLGQLEQAETNLAALSQEDAARTAAVEVRARWLLASGQPSDAAAALRPRMSDADAAEPPTADHWVLYGHALIAADRVDEAARAYDRALSLDAAHPEALVGRARVELRAQRFWRALRYLDLLAQTSSNRAIDPSLRGEAWIARARASLGAGQPENARIALEEAKKIDSISPEVWFLSGEAYAGANTPAARQAYETYLRLAPDGPFADRARRALAPRGRQITASDHP